MIYRILNFLVNIAIRVFFKSIKIKNEHLIPKKGPLIIVANHPGTFMDPLVIAVRLKRKIFFLAKAEVFKSSFAKWLLPKFNMIPVYRKQDDASQMHKNEETFEKCFDHLSNEGALLIFPEGISLIERKLRKIKTGAARIALGAENINGFKLGVKIIPIGLNYSDPRKFQSDLFINIDEPIHVIEYLDQYKRNSFEAAEQLTEKIREKLEGLIIAIEDDELDRLIKKIETVYKSKLLSEMGSSAKNTEHDFDITQQLVSAVRYFNDKDPARVNKIKLEVENYFSSLERLKLSDTWVGGFARKKFLMVKGFLNIFYLLAGFPLYVFGVINNYIPYKLPYYFARKLSDRPEFYGAISMVTGIFTFILFYSLQIYLIHQLFSTLEITVAYGLLLPLSGFFAYIYWKHFINVRGKLWVITLFMKRSQLIAHLVEQRKAILDELEEGRKEYQVLGAGAGN